MIIYFGLQKPVFTVNVLAKVVLHKKSPLQIHIDVFCSATPHENDTTLLNILPTKTFVETKSELVEVGSGLASFGSLIDVFYSDMDIT